MLSWLQTITAAPCRPPPLSAVGGSSSARRFGADPSSWSTAFFSFTLISADEVQHQFRVTPHMCVNSPYLQSARDVEATEGSVPVGSAQAIRDYVAYLQYRELRQQLDTELSNTPAAKASDLPQAHASARQPSSSSAPNWHEDAAARRATAAAEASDDYWLSPRLWDGGGLEDWLWEESISAEHGAVGRAAAGGGGPHGYEVQPLDCDRTYARHADQLRHWLTSAELATVRGEAPPAEDVAEDASDGAAAATPHHTVAEHAGSGYQDAQLSASPDALARRAPSSSSDLSSSLSSASVSSSSLTAYTADARAQLPTDTPAPCGLGQRLGYGAYVASEEQDGVFFVERVLLSHEWNRISSAVADRQSNSNSITAASHASRCHRDAAPATDSGGRSGATTVRSGGSQEPSAQTRTTPVLLTAHQQRRLLELIAVADFMGTQALVELCSTYLAAWLMDASDEDLMRSFLVNDRQEGDAAQPTTLQLTGATAFQEPWIAARADEAESGAAGEAGSIASAVQPSTVPPRKETKASKKKAAAAAAAATRQALPKHKGQRRGGDAAADAEVRVAEDEGSGGAEAAAAASGTRGPPPLLSGDQRLCVLRQMKRDHSIEVSPY